MDIPAPAASRLPTWARWTILTLFGLFALGALGFSVGAGVATVEAGFTGKRLALILAGLAPLPLFALLVRRIGLYSPDEPVARNVKQANAVIGWSLGLGAFIGLVVAIGADRASGDGQIFSNGPVSLGAALAAIAAYCIGGTLMTWRWLTKADELEREANKFGALCGVFASMLLTPVWWMLWRTGLLGEPDAMIVFLVVTTVYTFGYLWHRNR